MELAYCQDLPEYEWKKADYAKYYVPEMDAHFYIEHWTSDSIKSFLKKGLYWEGSIANEIKRFTKKNSTVIDVGAHIGVHTIMMSRTVGPGGSVIAFEPQKKIYQELMQNLKLNSCGNVLSINKAVGESNRMVQMEIRDPKNEGGTAIGEGGDIAEMITLDSMNLANVSLIKVDVERYEYYVFKGAEKTILENRPVLIFEVMGNHDYKTGTDEIKQRFDQVFSLVESFRYKVFLIFGNDYIAFPIETLTIDEE
jgi:FkbM family methyltransferase